GGTLTVGHGGDGIGHAGVPEKPSLGMLDQIAADDEVHRLAHIHARRPARNVARYTLAAVQDVEPLNSRSAALRGRRRDRERHRKPPGQGEPKVNWFHDIPPAVLSFSGARESASNTIITRS